jgi:hypothetical protein
VYFSGSLRSERSREVILLTSMLRRVVKKIVHDDRTIVLKLQVGQ